MSLRDPCQAAPPAARREPSGERSRNGRAAITKELVEIVSGAEAL